MTWFITAGAVLCAAVAIAACVAVTSHRRVSIVTVGIGLATLGLGSFAVLVVGVVRGLDLFGIAHMLYLQATLAVPLLGAGLLVLGRWRRISTAGVVVSLALLVPAPIGVWASHIAPFRLQVDEHRVPVTGGHAGQGTVRIAVLADLQTTGIGDHERAAVRAVLDARPDVILVPGDLFQADDAALATEGPAVRELLAQLDAPRWCVPGRGRRGPRGAPGGAGAAQRHPSGRPGRRGARR